MKEDLSKLRKNYNSGELNEKNLLRDPFFQFDSWFKEELKSELWEPNAMILSTSNTENKPSSRVVLLKGYSDKGFVFFTNYKSRKGEEIAQNSNVSLLFFWPQLDRQVRIEGTIKKTSAKESDEYFKTRPLESQAAAVVSEQSSIVDDWNKFHESFQNKIQNKSFERPKQWGGYCVIPNRFEFWQGRSSRLHDRFQFVFENKKWRIERLYP